MNPGLQRIDQSVRTNLAEAEKLLKIRYEGEIASEIIGRTGVVLVTRHSGTSGNTQTLVMPPLPVGDGLEEIDKRVAESASKSIFKNRGQYAKTGDVLTFTRVGDLVSLINAR